MTKIFRLGLFVSLILLCTQLSAQDSRRGPVPFGQQLWYGGNFALGFSSFNGISSFQIGIAPMVGYKFSNTISAGPRASLIYNSFRLRDPFTNEVQSNNVFTWSIGVFGRAKVYRGAFLQVEYAYENEPLLNQNTFDIVRRTRGNVYVGAGWNYGQGQGFGSEIMVLYNLSVANNTLESPWDFRFGFTNNF